MTVDFILSSNVITSKMSDIENRAYLDRISREISNLDSSSDSMLFLQQMVRNSALLSCFERNLDIHFHLLIIMHNILPLIQETY